MNDDEVKAALSLLREAVINEVNTRGQKDHGYWYGARRGIYKVLLSLGFVDAAQHVVNEVYEERGIVDGAEDEQVAGVRADGIERDGEGSERRRFVYRKAYPTGN